MMSDITGSLAAAVEELDGLETPDAVCEFLRAQGIKGRIGSGPSCPIANFVKARTGAKSVDVPGSCVTVAIGTAGKVRIRGVVRANLADPVRDFIYKFDKGGYRDLVG